MPVMFKDVLSGSVEVVNPAFVASVSQYSNGKGGVWCDIHIATDGPGRPGRVITVALTAAEASARIWP